jgi:hypothetical protein
MGTTTLRTDVRNAPELHRAGLDADPHSPGGHDHVWDHALSRGGFVKGAGALMATSLLLPGLARAGGKVTTAAPSPIPPNPDFFGLHVYFPVEGSEPASIFDFNGFCGVTELQGTGMLTMDGETTPAVFDVDNRFMTGEYVGADGRMHHGTFGFI